MHIVFVSSLNEVDAQAWNQLCADGYPFVRHGFLRVLELSGSVGTDAESGEETGWQAQHLLAYEGDELIAALPLYIKRHSYGEYVFDWSWADAYKRYGLHYYPKLISAIPFTPCSGARLLLKNASQRAALLPEILTALQQHVHHRELSGWHCLFPTEELSVALQSAQISQRVGVQFHWFNRGYNSWDDFVATMNSRKRKNINKERRAVVEQGIRFTAKSGAQIDASDWQLFYQFYCSTYLKRSGHTGYLTREFFELLGEHCADNVLLIIAHQHDKPIAAALFFIDEQTIYGRYWGSLADFDFLHFETCYYQGIDYAIQQGLQRFDGGAQGEHKIQRGFEPVFTYSNHWLVRGEFRQAIHHFLAEEKISIEHYAEEARAYLPFKE